MSATDASGEVEGDAPHKVFALPSTRVFRGCTADSSLLLPHTQRRGPKILGPKSPNLYRPYISPTSAKFTWEHENGLSKLEPLRCPKSEGLKLKLTLWPF